MQPATFSYSIVTDRRLMPATAAFYQEHFDLESTLDIGWFASLRRGDTAWELCLWDAAHDALPPGFSTTQGGGIIAFIVDDARAVADRLSAAGVALVTPVIDEPWGQRHLYVRDPAGTTIDVVQVTSPDPAWLAEQGLA